MSLSLVEAHRYDAIEDPSYQNYLAGRNLLLRQNKLEPLSLNLEGKQEMAANLLNNRIGTLVSDREFSRELYGKEGLENRARSLVRSLPNNHDLTNIYRVDGLGWGLGVENVLLDMFDVSAVYKLWQSEGKFVGLPELTEYCSGRTTRRGIMTMRIRMWNIAKDPKTSPLTIDEVSFGQDGLFYRLTSTDPDASEKDKKVQAEVHAIEKGHWFTTPYQRWLAGQNLMHRRGEIPSDDRGRMLSDLKGAPKRVISALIRNYQFVVPHSDLIRIAFRQKASKDNMRRLSNVLNEARAAGVEDIHPLSSHINLGYSFGVDNIHLARTQLLMLFHLWSHAGQFVNYDVLRNSIQSEIGRQQTIGTFRTSLSELRRGLEGTNYRVGTRIPLTNQQPALILVPKKDIKLPA